MLKSGRDGAVAQLGERLLCKQDVIGSIPVSSTIHSRIKASESLLEVEILRKAEFEPWAEMLEPPQGAIATLSRSTIFDN